MFIQSDWRDLIINPNVINFEKYNATLEQDNKAAFLACKEISNGYLIISNSARTWRLAVNVQDSGFHA
jgi:hypothetical protein